MNSGKTFKRRENLAASALPPTASSEGSEIVTSELVQSPDSSAGYSFAKFLATPQVDPARLGMTARVSRIVAKAGSESVVAAPVSEEERQRWQKDKIELEDQIIWLKKELRKFRGEHHDFNDLDYEEIDINLMRGPERPAVEGSLLVELELLRKENFELRNMKNEEKMSKASDIIKKLNSEKEELKEENVRLKHQVDGLLRARETLANQRPPVDVISTLRRLPMELSESDRDRIFQTLENEWKNDYLESRHGGGDPIKNPFQKRRP
jgi:FtsZ-binding cell division protein ZapB